MSYLQLQQNGDIDIVLTNQTDINDEELRLIQPLQSQSTQLDFAENELKNEIANIEIKLADNPDYIKLQKLKSKITIVRKMKQETEIILNNEMRKIFKRNGVCDVADKVANALPEPKPKGKRGRPSLRSAE